MTPRRAMRLAVLPTWNRKGREARTQSEAVEIAEEWAATIHDQLADAASEALLNPLQQSEVSGHEGEMLLNGGEPP
jgi:hypothetical protein